MRFYEFLAEASLTPAEIIKYPWRKELFLEKIANGDKFELTPESQDIFGTKEVTIKKEELDKVRGVLDGKVKAARIETEEAGSIPFSAIQKTKEFQKAAGGSDFNAGNVAEGLIASALAAKFLLKGESISEEDVLGIIREIDKEYKTHGKSKTQIGIGRWTGEIPWEEGKTDIIKLVIGLNFTDFNIFVDTERVTKENQLLGLLRSAVAYVNANRTIPLYVDQIKQDTGSDTVDIMSVGLEDQSGTKVDIRLLINGEPAKLQLSLKTGKGKQFGQVGGASLDNMKAFFGQIFGIKIPDSIGQKDEGEVPFEAYKHAFETIKKELSGKNQKKETRFVDRLADGIRYFATKGERILLVSLKDTPNKAGFDELEFENLLPKMENIDLSAEFGGTETNPQIRILANGKELVKIRHKKETGSGGRLYGRNYVESGPALKSLASTDPEKAKNL